MTLNSANATFPIGQIVAYTAAEGDVTAILTEVIGSPFVDRESIMIPVQGRPSGARVDQLLAITADVTKAAD